MAEFDRTALYLLVFATFATLPRQRMRIVMLAVGVGIAVIGIAGLATRVRPDLFPLELTDESAGRLSYPVSYWNAMGVLLACGLVLCLHFASEVSGPRAIRVIAAALFPALAATLYLTLSRG